MALDKILTLEDDSKLHKVSYKELFSQLGSDDQGLPDKEVRERLKQCGPNKLSEEEKTPYIIQFLLQFKNFFSILLLIGSALSFISEWVYPDQGSIYIAWALLGVTLLNAIFTFLQEFKAEQAMESFKNLMTTKVIVIRDRKEVEIDSENLVPGDIVVLNEGDKISTDARLLEVNNLKVDHSSLTGESEPQLRSLDPTNEKPILSRNMVFSGTLVQSGSGKAVVITTGDNTRIGKIAKLTRDYENTESHMQKEITHFIKVISYIAIALGISFFGLGFLVGNTVWINLVFAIGIIVANVPEGLLPTVTLTLSIAAQKMAKKNALVKNMDAIETLGSLTVICSDKTGTLTQNKLSVNSFYMNDTLYHFDDSTKSVLIDGRKQTPETIRGFEEMAQILSACNNSVFDHKTKKSHGDPTEISLHQFFSNFIRSKFTFVDLKRNHEIPFDSSKKYMVTANVVNKKQKAFLKGAPEAVVLHKCSKVFKNGRIVKMTPKLKKEILQKNKEFSSKGFRVLAYAAKDISSKSKAQYEKDLEKGDYVYYGLIILYDPPRPEVKEAVRQCHEAGIRIVVISGDQGNTVQNIAEEVGIVQTGNPKVVTSDELKKMTDKQLRKLVKEKELIFARSLPEDKLRIVKALQDEKEIVAVTGDGVNDAPALKRADVGVSMGKVGTEVAKEASDVVLLDDNFATIVEAIKQGRTVYDNIQSFIIYILTSNIPEIVPFLLFVLLAPINWPLALPVLLILAIDLGTDMLPAISLGQEPPAPDVMTRPPRNPKAKLCNTRMVLRSYGFQGPLETIFGYVVFFAILFQGGWSFAQAVPAARDPLYMSAVAGFFSTIVVFQIFNLFACRTANESIFKAGLFKNKTAIIGICTEVALLLAIVLFPPAEMVFGTAPFPLEYVPLMVVGGFALLMLEELRKYLYRKYGILKIRSE
ncbi:MAG: cation-translocating P-type ATPase [Nanoarchaeota archaeon]